MGTRSDGSEWLYEQARQKLNDAVLRRNQMLLELDAMATLPLNINPASGIVVEFSSKRALRLIELIEKETLEIDGVMAEVNQYAKEARGMPIAWRALRNRRDDD